MKVEHINPFVNAVTNAFDTMLGLEVRRGDLSLADPRRRKHPISGVIGLTGEAVGTVVINLSEEVAMKVASALLMDDIHEMCDDVIDSVGELANIVAGQAKVHLHQYSLSVSLPSVVTGVGHEIRFPSSAPPICVPFETDFGQLLLEVGFETSPVAVHA